MVVATSSHNETSSASSIVPAQNHSSPSVPPSTNSEELRLHLTSMDQKDIASHLSGIDTTLSDDESLATSSVSMNSTKPSEFKGFDYDSDYEESFLKENRSFSTEDVRSESLPKSDANIGRDKERLEKYRNLEEEIDSRINQLQLAKISKLVEIYSKLEDVYHSQPARSDRPLSDVREVSQIDGGSNMGEGNVHTRPRSVIHQVSVESSADPMLADDMAVNIVGKNSIVASADIDSASCDSRSASSSVASFSSVPLLPYKEEYFKSKRLEWTEALDSFQQTA
jgi:hypothetical protein